MVWDEIWAYVERSFLLVDCLSWCLGLKVIKVLLSRVFFLWGYRFFMVISSCLHLALKAFCSESFNEGSRLLMVKIFLNSLFNSYSSLSLFSSIYSSNRIFLSLSASIFSLFSSCCNFSLSSAFSFSFSSSILMYSILGSLFVFKYKEKRSSF